MQAATASSEKSNQNTTLYLFGLAVFTTVVLPVVALGLSTIFEGFQWTLWGVGGIALIVSGNIIVMRR